MELFNEVCITFATQQLVLFTDFVPEAEDKFTCGWIFIATLVIQMAVNLVFILQRISRAFYLFGVKYLKRYKYWLKINEKQEPELADDLE